MSRDGDQDDDRPAFLIIEDHPMVARAFVGAIRRSAHAERVRTLAGADRALPTRAWTGIVLDLSLPDGSGLEWLARLRARPCSVPVLVVTGSPDAMVANECHRLRASCVFKPHVGANLQAFVRRAIAARARPQERTAAAVRELGAALDLTPREMQIAELVALGIDRERLADALGISENTVKTTVRRLLAKCGETRVEGVARVVHEEILRLASDEGDGDASAS